VSRAGFHRTRRFRAGLLCVLSALAIVAIAPAALAQQAPGTSRVVEVDMSTSPQAVIVRADAKPSDAVVTVNKQGVKNLTVSSAGEAGYRTDNILIIDNSASAIPFAAGIQAAAQNFVAALQPNERVAIVAAGGAAQFETAGLIADTTILTQKAQLANKGGQALYDAIVLGARHLDSQAESIHSVTVITASPDIGSFATAASARAEAIAATASLNFVTLTSNEFPATATGIAAQLASETGGQFVTTSDPAKVPELTAQLAKRVRNLHAIRFETDQVSTGGNLAVQLGGENLEVGFLPSAVTRGGALNQLAGDGSSGIGFLRSGTGLLIGIVLGALAAGLVAYAAGMLFTKDDNRLVNVLSPYAGEGDGDEDSGRHALFQRAVEITGNLAERQGQLEKVEGMLERANMPLRAAEAITGYIGIIIASGLLGVLYKRNLFWGLIFAVLGALIPPSVVNFKGKRRRKKFVSQLPDMLQLLAGTLKAGYSFMQGVETVSQEVEEPMGTELRRVVTEAQLGRPVEEALDGAAERMDSLDFAWAVMAVRIQREVGGNLSELLMTVAETMTARQRLRGEVQALTAEGRVSAMVLGGLPIGLAGMLYVINGEYMGLLFSESIGRIMLIGSSLLAGAGFLWMKKIIDIKI
jgi:tight adherence protein B